MKPLLDLSAEYHAMEGCDYFGKAARAARRARRTWAVDQVRQMKVGDACMVKTRSEARTLWQAAIGAGLSGTTSSHHGQFLFMLCASGHQRRPGPQRVQSPPATFELDKLQLCYFAALCHALRLIDEKAEDKAIEVDRLDSDALVDYVRVKGDQLVALNFPDERKIAA